MIQRFLTPTLEDSLILLKMK